MPSAWRRGLGKAPETRPRLLFMDLPDPSTPDSPSKNLAAGPILELVKENSRPHIPVFGVSGKLPAAKCALRISPNSSEA
jgi:hypothetical protein